jgi:DNA-binding PadR family transcriptional regulator
VSIYTELESTVLGLVEKHGPCTAYEIMRLFQASPTSSWRASSGSIYPLVKKLLRLGLLTAQPGGAGGRKASLVSLSPAGRAALVQWLLHEPDGLGDPSSDPIRSRLMFVGQLPPAQRRGFVERALELTEQSIGSLTEIIAGIAASEQLELFAHQGALLQLEARRDWLRALLPQFPAG